MIAAELLAEVISLDPTSVAACVNYGTVLHELRRFEEAVGTCERAIALAPDCAQAFYNRGNALRELNRLAAAVDSYDRAIVLKSNYADAYLNRGLALSAWGRPGEAIASYEIAIHISPQSPDPYFNKGNEQHQVGHLEAAIGSYDRAIALQPGFADAHLNRGTALVAIHRYADAIASYDKAIALRPLAAQAHLNRGGALQYMGLYTAAVASFDRAIALQPGYADAHLSRGAILALLRRYPEAIASYDQALSLNPHATATIGARRHTQMQICDWHGLEHDVDKIAKDVDGDATNPFILLTLCDSAGLQQRAAAKWIADLGPTAPLIPIPKRGRDDRIRVGYFSADFHEHATSCLIAQLLEVHDRSRFRITGFSFGPPSAGPMRVRLQTACDEFIDVRARSDLAVATLARSRGIDIAVDLKGFTKDSRAGIFAHRAAPLQVNFLGYPGTMGASFMDYLIADRTLIPAHSELHYTEKIIYMPHSYQVNDATRTIAAGSFTRVELNLPATGMVFCCFNNAYKIAPLVFDRWMRILAQVEGSVLWMLGDDPAMRRNLRREAAARGIAPERLIFADRTDLPHHLARHQAADLFLDTLPYNAHTTASDALWAGLPVLTCPGESFAARVAASLLKAVGLPELIASSPEHYEQIAVRLATDRAAMNNIRQRLLEKRLTAPLFDTPRYSKHLESAFVEIHERYLADARPQHLYVE